MKLNEGDKFSLITYSTKDNIILDDITFSKNKINNIIETILAIKIYGYTNGSKGLETAYKIIKQNYDKDAINRVIIFTDGDFNFGNNKIDDVKKLILKKKETGAYLSVVGTGYYNTNDELMETLAKNGNGNYMSVNTIEDVKDNIVNRYNQIMYTIATDVKAQVEFNPNIVESYKLIGYENRKISQTEFNDDDSIAEPFGSGTQVVALYEIKLGNGTLSGQKLKYQTQNIVDSDELCTINIRYKEIGEKESKLLSKGVKFEITESEESQKAYIAYVTAEHLRRSDSIDEDDIKTAKEMITKYLDDDTMNLYQNFLHLQF